MKRLNKLVRDRIPDMIQADGRTCEVEVLEGEDFDRALRAKLVEEAQEVAGADTHEGLIVELADVLEVVESLMAWHGIDKAAVLAVQSTRRSERGGFEKRLWVGAVGAG